MKLRYLVTGTGRCGTVFMARFLTSVGIPCGHESIFDWRGYRWAEKKLNGEHPIQCSYASMMSLKNGKWVSESQWVNPVEIVAESSYLAAPFLGSSLLSDVSVIHVVRNPVKVINSFCNYLGYFQSEQPGNSYEHCIYRQCPELREAMPSYDRAALFYVLWNDLIDSHCDCRHKIEDDPVKVSDFVKGSGEGFDDRTINTQQKPGQRFAIGQLKSQEIKSRLFDKCSQYGYLDQMGSDTLSF